MNGQQASGTNAGNEPSFRIDRDLDELAELARRGLEPSSFYQDLLGRAGRILDLRGGVHWKRGAGDRFQVSVLHGLDASWLAADSVTRRRRVERLNRCVATGESCLVPFISSSGGDSTDSHPADQTEKSRLVPILLDGAVVGVLEFVHLSSSGGGSDDERGITQALADTAADYEADRQRRELLTRCQDDARLEELTRRLHAVRKPADAACVMANEGRRFLGCDRVSVAVWRHGKPRILSISSVDTVDRRADAIVQLEELALLVGRLGEATWHPGNEPTYPKLEESLNRYVDRSHARSIGIVPLFSRREESSAEEETAERRGTERDDPPIGVMVVESFGQSDRERLSDRMRVALPYFAQSLRNSIDYAGLPGLSLLTGITRGIDRMTSGGRAKAAAALVLAVAAVAALLLVPAELRIEATGELQPALRRQVFAPMEAEVSELLVEHDQRVRRGQPLMRLESTELKLESRRVRGEREACFERLQAIESTLSLRDPNDVQATSDVQLSATRQELRELLRGYDEQLELLRKERERLDVTCPIDGRVLTWDIEQLLFGRPVRKGQVLATIADDEGDWVLELRVADSDVGHVLDARRLRPDLRVDYLLKAEPSAGHEGHVLDVARNASVESPTTTSVLVKVAIDRQALNDPRPGATVVARIDCGTRRLGYVWLRRLIEFCQKRSWFW